MGSDRRTLGARAGGGGRGEAAGPASARSAGKSSTRPSSRADGPSHDAALRSAVEGLSRLADAFDRRRQQLARDLELSDAQLRVLEEIARDDFMPSLFARRRACSPAGVSRTLRQLQERGLIRAGIGATDGRQRTYALTARGRRLVDRLRDRRLAALDAIWRTLPARDLARFGAFSQRLADRLDDYADRVSDAH